MEYKIQNIVATAKLAPHLHLKSIRDLEPFRTLAHKGRQEWLGFRLGPQHRYAALYPNGNVLVAGCRSLTEVNELLSEAKRMLAPCVKIISDIVKIEIRNIVATSDLQAPIDLRSLAESLDSESAQYEPEQFPGLILRLHDPEVAVLVFSNGKLVVAGAHSFNEVDQAIVSARSLANGLG